MMIMTYFLEALSGSAGSSQISLLILTSVVVAATTLLVKEMYSTKTSKKPLPPMASYGFIETVRAVSSSDGPWFLQRIARSKIGTIFRIKLSPFGFGSDFVVVGDARLAQSVMRNSENYKPAFLYGNFEPISRGPSIFTAEGHRWHHARKATAPAFSSKNIQNVNATVLGQINEWVQEDLIPNYVEKEAPFDVAAVFLRQVLKGISVAGFDYEMADEEIEVFLREWEIALKENLAQSVNPIRKMVGKFDSTGRRYAVAVGRNHAFAKKVLENYRSLEHPSDGTIISMIANNPKYESDNERISDIMTFYLAGHDTTAYSLAWIFLELAKNQSEQTKLRSALQNVPKDEWKNVPELRHALKEGLRLHPVAANGSWRVLKNDIETDKYHLAKGTNIQIPMLVIHRNIDYVERPDEFIPSRWIDPSDDLSSAYVPFALGRRNCVGQALAYSEIYNCLATLIVDYEFSVFDEGTVDYFLTLKPVGAKLIAKKV